MVFYPVGFIVRHITIRITVWFTPSIIIYFKITERDVYMKVINQFNSYLFHTLLPDKRWTYSLHYKYPFMCSCVFLLYYLTRNKHDLYFQSLLYYLTRNKHILCFQILLCYPTRNKNYLYFQSCSLQQAE